MRLEHGHLHASAVPMCKLHVLAASHSNLHQWMLVPSPADLRQLALVVFFFQPMVQTLQLHSCNLHCVMAECGGASCILNDYVVAEVVTM